MFDKLAEEYQDQSMTLPDERYRAVFRTSEFLLELQQREDIPKEVKAEARGLLRHYPTYYDLQRLSAACPEVMIERYEDLHRFIIQGQAAAEGETDGRS